MDEPPLAEGVARVEGPVDYPKQLWPYEVNRETDLPNRVDLFDHRWGRVVVFPVCDCGQLGNA